MAVITTIMQFIAQGGSTVKAQIGEIGTVAKATNTAVDQLKTALKGLAAGLALEKLANYADTFTNIQNQLKLTAKNSVELAEKTKLVFDISQRTRTDFESNATVYLRLTDSLRSMGKSAADAGPLLELITQAVAVSGTTAGAARAGLQQFGQALASGVLRGDEFNSVMENTPGLARALAIGLNAPIGALRGMAEKGMLTTNVVLPALQRAAPQVAAAFAQMTPTIGQAFTVLSNAVVKMTGDVNASTGIFTAFAYAVLFVANNLTLLSQVALVAAAAFAAWQIAAFVGWLWGAVTATGSLAAAMQLLWLNPFTILPALIAATVAAMYIFGDSLKFASLGGISLRDILVLAFGFIKDMITGMIGAVQFLVQMFVEGAKVILAGWMAIYNFFEPLINLIIRMGTEFVKAGAMMVSIISNAIDSFFGLDGAIGKAFDSVVKFFAWCIQQAKEAYDTIMMLARAFGVVGTEAENAGKKTKSTWDQVKDLFANLNTQIGSTGGAFKSGLDNLPKLDYSAKKTATSVATIATAADDVATHIQGGVAAGISSLGELQGAAERTATAISNVSLKTAFTSGPLINSLGGTSQAGDSNGKFEYSARILPQSGQGWEQFYKFQDGKGANRELISQLQSIAQNYAKITRFTGSEQNFEAVDFRASNRDKVQRGLQVLGKDQFLAALGPILGPELLAFRSGGSFTVGGTGASDSELVAFKATRGERVTVENTRQQMEKGEGASHKVLINLNINGADVNGFKRNKAQIYRELVQELGKAVQKA